MHVIVWCIFLGLWPRNEIAGSYGKFVFNSIETAKLFSKRPTICIQFNVFYVILILEIWKVLSDFTAMWRKVLLNKIMDVGGLWQFLT